MAKIYKMRVCATVYSVQQRLSLPDLAEAVGEEIWLDSHAIQVTPVNGLGSLSEEVLDDYPYGDGGNLKTIREWLQDGKS